MTDCATDSGSPAGLLRSRALILSLALFALPAAWGEVKVTDAWVRGTVAAQKSTGAFMTLTSMEGARLRGVASPAARIVEMHHSSMNGGVMQMRAVEAIELPAGRPVALEPGGYHVMLMGLARPVKPGDKVPLVLEIEDRQGKRSKLEVTAEVRPLGAR